MKTVKRTEDREAGMLTVEAVLSLVPFILVILGITSFINIFAVHNRIQYALYQMGSELSGYTYLYQALGLRAADLKLKSDADADTEKVDGAIADIGDFMDQITSLDSSLRPENGRLDPDEVVNQAEATWNAGTKAASSSRELLSNPKDLIRGFVYLGIEYAEDKAKSLLLDTISGGMMEVYLDESFARYGSRTADEYLKSYGVKDGMEGLDFSSSEFLSDDLYQYRMIDITVEYDLEIYFFKLFFKDPTVHVVQRVMVPAWLDGDGITYTK